MNIPESVDSNEPSMQQLMLEIVRSLVDDANAVRVDVLEADHGVTILNVRVAPSDTRKVIGKNGHMARSLRIVLSAASMKLRRVYALTIEESGGVGWSTVE